MGATVKEAGMGGRHRAIATDTRQILDRGWYDHPAAGRVRIADDLARSAEGTRMWAPEESQAALDGITALDEITARADTAAAAGTRVEVTGETSLTAARRLGAPVGCLNFASAKNPGGGFLGGAQAQEESLARSSGLYPCLLRAREFYEFHRGQRDLRYSDRMIFSPSVPVFRDDDGTLLEQPHLVSFLTAAAPNAGALGTGHPDAATLPEVLSARAAKVLAVLLASGQRRIVLGAWGCGVFRNAPDAVAAVFARLLGPEGAFHGRFEQVTFAVLDRAPGTPTLSAFTAALGCPR
jgi:uncharacterized protein (TIGR02452 family)